MTNRSILTKTTGRLLVAVAAMLSVMLAPVAAPAADALGSFDSEVLEYINDYRAELGLPALIEHPPLSAAALAWSGDIASRQATGVCAEVVGEVYDDADNVATNGVPAGATTVVEQFTNECGWEGYYAGVSGGSDSFPECGWKKDLPRPVDQWCGLVFGGASYAAMVDPATTHIGLGTSFLDWNSFFGAERHAFTVARFAAVPPTCYGEVVTINMNEVSSSSFAFGTDGDDVILGTPGDDVIYGGAGRDLICGMGGDDKIYGEAGGDRINGGDGDDTLYGNDGWDKLTGAAGNDTITGGQGDDQLFGGGDNDTLDGGIGNDLILGYDGDDVITGGDGKDLINGQNGDDMIDGGAQHDQIWGRLGDDTINGGDGYDWIWGYWGNDTIDGGGGPDSLFGEGGNDVMSGGPGNDLLDGSFGSDRLSGGDGDDTLRGGFLDDILDGGPGNDTCDSGADDTATTCEAPVAVP